MASGENESCAVLFSKHILYQQIDNVNWCCSHSSMCTWGWVCMLKNAYIARKCVGVCVCLVLLERGEELGVGVSIL